VSEDLDRIAGGGDKEFNAMVAATVKLVTEKLASPKQLPFLARLRRRDVDMLFEQAAVIMGLPVPYLVQLFEAKIVLLMAEGGTVRQDMKDMVELVTRPRTISSEKKTTIWRRRDGRE